MLESRRRPEAVFAIPAVGMRCLEMDPRADTPLLEIRHEAFAIDARFSFVNADDEQMPCMTMIPFGKRQWLDPRDIDQFLEVAMLCPFFCR